MTPKYRINWKSLLTQKEGHGEYIFTKEEAENIIERLNSKYENIIHHWIEREEDDEIYEDYIEEGKHAQRTKIQNLWEISYGFEKKFYRIRFH